MYFKKLEIFGFKSFAEKTVLNFEPGITAVVGPNGCGKSNIFDAIRWVLGEQSVKQLRGSAMEDVIFNGTDKRPSLGFAEVSLTLSNESKMLPVEDKEVVISRRLYRSGESEYLLNKTSVRLKDIQEMLMGTGIGAEAYSLIQQGKVEMVVSAKPEDRRMILDEAAGITKYKAKKKEALSKLKSTEDNLLRVNDIITEVKRQISSIERQANKARKYKDEFDKLKGMELGLAQYQVSHFHVERDKLSAKIAELQGREEELTREVDSLNESLTNEINYLGEIDQKINEVHSDEIKLQGQIDLASRQVDFNRERIENLNQEAARYNEQKEQLIIRCKTQQGRIENLKETIMHLEATIKLNADTILAKKEELTLLERSLKEAKDKIREDEEKILTLTSKQVNVRNEVTDIMKEIQGCLARKRRLEMENDKVTTEKQMIDQKLQTVQFQLTTLQGVIRDLEAEKAAGLTTLSDLTSGLDSLDKQIAGLERKKLFFISQREFIEKLNVQYQDIPDPIIEGRIITSVAPLPHHTGILGKVKEVKEVPPEMFNVLSQNFGAQGSALYEIICETKFIELDPQQIDLRIDEIEIEIQKVQAERTEQLAKVDTQRKVIEGIDQSIVSKERNVSVLSAQQKDIEEEVNKLTSELDLVGTELSEVREDLGINKKKEDELNYQLDTLNQDIQWCQNDIKDKQSAIAEKSQQKEDTTVLIAQLETEAQSNEDKLKSLNENLTSLSESLDNWLEEMKKIDDELSGHGQKREKFEAEITTLNEAIEKNTSEKESLKTVLQEHEAQKIDMGQKINGMRANINGYEGELEQIRDDLHKLQMNEQSIGFEERGIKDRLLQAYKMDIENKKEESLESADGSVIVESVQEEITADAIINQETVSSEEGIMQGFTPKAALVEEAIIAIEVNEENVESMKHEIERLRRRCESFGSVNLVAIEEYEQMKDRFEFLTKQQSDLLEAKSQLMSTITKINRSTRQMFMDSFTKVSEEFRIYFRMLFGGGEAQLILLDPENVLESGIDIIAKPPGKKLQNISLLSGGEKSLTAIALIFGVFKVNPSPFCVLDEIDAALDESNVGRFSFLLKDFSKIAQFIVITHNKKTISSADVMYGITMPETGMSKIVSVKFADQKQKEAEAVPVGA